MQHAKPSTLAPRPSACPEKLKAKPGSIDPQPSTLDSSTLVPRPSTLAPRPSSLGPRPSLGIVAICRNEERDLPGFLACLLPWVDEIVLVDDGSTDRTEAIARAAGEKVNFIQSKRKEGEYYADQRNKGIDAAKSDWLLHMDIDERVTQSLKIEISAAIKNPAFDGYRYRRTNYFLHRPMRGGGWQDWNLIHLARRELFRFGGMFHESCHLDAPETRVGQLKGTMAHLNDESYAERMHKSLNYVPEVANRYRESGKRITAFTLLLEPIKEFIKKWLLRNGYRDGIPGLIFALHSAAARFKAVAMVWDAQNHIPREKLEAEIGARVEGSRASRGVEGRGSSDEGPGLRFQLRRASRGARASEDKDGKDL